MSSSVYTRTRRAAAKSCAHSRATRPSRHKIRLFIAARPGGHCVQRLSGTMEKASAKRDAGNLPRRTFSTSYKGCHLTAVCRAARLSSGDATKSLVPLCRPFGVAGRPQCGSIRSPRCPTSHVNVVDGKKKSWAPYEGGKWRGIGLQLLAPRSAQGNWSLVPPVRSSRGFCVSAVAPPPRRLDGPRAVVHVDAC